MITVLKEFYPDIFYFICALHKMKNIGWHKSMNKTSCGEDFYTLLKHLPFNTSKENVNVIISEFLLSEATDASKLYICKIFRNIKNWC